MMILTIPLTIISLIAGLLLSVVSNWIYDVCRQKGWFPDNPSFKRVIILIFLFLPLVFIVALPDWVGSFIGRETGLHSMTFRVVDSKGMSISGAKLLLFLVEGVIEKYTDGNGVVEFEVDTSKTLSAQYVVETDKYQIIGPEHIRTDISEVVLIKLIERTDDDKSKVIIRVIDSETHLPVPYAAILLVAGGDIQSQVTDSDGIAVFHLIPHNGVILADVNITSGDVTIDYRQRELQPERIQDFLFDTLGERLLNLSSGGRET